MKFVVTGCGRSGTGYTSRLFTNMDALCGHESVFNAHFVTHGIPDASSKGAYMADSSWVAAGILHEYDIEPEVEYVVHQVRNPVCVIRSLMGVNQFGRTPPGRYADYVYRLSCGEVSKDEEPLIRCMQFWVYWNRLTEKLGDRFPYMRWQVEDISSNPAAFLFPVLPVLGIRRDLETLRKAVAETSTATNTRDRDQSVMWDSLPASKEKDAIMFMAIGYGYPLAELEEA